MIAALLLVALAGPAAAAPAQIADAVTRPPNIVLIVADDATVQQMAQKYISDDKATIVVVGDRKTIEEQIKPYGPLS